jgi:hypothetical protein
MVLVLYCHQRIGKNQSYVDIKILWKIREEKKGLDR